MIERDGNSDASVSRAVTNALAGLLAVVLLVVAPRPIHCQEGLRTYILTERLEIQPSPSERPLSVDVTSWIGGDYRRLYLRLEGEQSTVEKGGGEWRADALMGRLISPYWSAVAGVRVDARPNPKLVVNTMPGGVKLRPAERVTRRMLAIGLVGLAPGMFEVQPTAYVSDKGDVSMDFQSTFDLLLTQRLIMQPRLEFNAAVQPVPEIGIGSGLNNIVFGARVRYEVHRKFAPYVGASWRRLTGATAAMAADVGRPKSVGTIVAGVRMWR